MNNCSVHHLKWKKTELLALQHRNIQKALNYVLELQNEEEQLVILCLHKLASKDIISPGFAVIVYLFFTYPSSVLTRRLF